MKLVKFLAFAALLGILAHDGTAQTSNTPDVTSASTFTTAANGPSLTLKSGNPNGSASWSLTWWVSGFSAATIHFQTSQDCSTFADADTSLVVIGVNPTAWTSSTLSNRIVLSVYTPCVRVAVDGLTGSGTVSTLVLGYRGTTAALNGGGGGGGGTCTRCQTALATPAAPTLQVNGTPGTSSCGYKVVAYNNIGYSSPSAEATVANCPNTLDNTNNVSVTASAAPAGSIGLIVWRTTNTTTSGTVGIIGDLTATGGTIVDNDSANQALGDGPGTPPVPTNTSAGLQVTGLIGSGGLRSYPSVFASYTEPVQAYLAGQGYWDIGELNPPPQPNTIGTFRATREFSMPVTGSTGAAIYGAAFGDSSGHISTVRAGDFDASNKGAGTIDGLSGVTIYVENNDGNTTVAQGLLILCLCDDTSGTIGTAYGVQIGGMFGNGINYALKIEDVTAGTDQFAVKTGAGKFQIGDYRLITTQHTPASSSEACTTGTLTFDATFLYGCTATNTYKRIPWVVF